MSDNCVDWVLAITLINKCSDYRILFVTVYQPPDNSLYGRDYAQLLSHFTNLVYTNVEYDVIYIATDMNGRIGAKIDYIETINIDISPRIPIDLEVKGHGEALLEFCSETKMCGVNGRFNPDKDNFTSIYTNGSAAVDDFLTNHRNLQNIENFEVITTCDVVDLLGVHGMAAVPVKISDHPMLVIDIFTRDTDVLRSVTEDSADRRPSERLIEGDIPSPLPRFRINEIPSDFLSSDESRQQLLNIKSDIEEVRNTQQVINKIYNCIVEVFITEMKGHFGLPFNSPRSRKKFRTRKEWWDEELTSQFREMQHTEHTYIKSK